MQYYYPRMRRYTATKTHRTVMATVLTADVMWALAAYADRVNCGEYVKDTQRDDTGAMIKQRNRDIIKEEASAGMPNLTQADYELGRAARQWHQGRLTFKTLRGQPLTDFEQGLSRAVQMEEFSSATDAMQAAIVASQISSYHKGEKEEQLMSTVDRSPLAPVGSKVVTEATVVRSVYSMNYGVTFVTAHTKCNRMIFFSYREDISAGAVIRVQGTVKAHRPDSTQLNRVKVL